MADDAVPGHHLRDRGQDEDDLLEYEREAEADEGNVLEHDGQHDGDDVRVDVLLVLAGQPALELETKVHPKVRNHGEGPY